MIKGSIRKGQFEGVAIDNRGLGIVVMASPQ
jgi:hypothetical protein